jgi:hypothetical protein
MSWADIENAVHKAVCLASGYAAEQVIWSFQDYNAPTLDYINLTFGGELALGQDWVRITQDLTRPAGQEIKIDIRGIREVPLQIEVFTSDVHGNDSARRVAEMVRTKLRLDGVRHGLRRAGLSPFDSDSVQWVPDIPTANFRGRAVLNVRCYVPVMDCYEYVGYIARVRGHIFPSGVMSYSGTSGIPFSYGVGSTAGTLYVYYGLAVPASIDETFIESLSSSTLAAGLQRTLTFSAGDGTQKAYYAFPSSFGTPATFIDVNTGFAIPNTQVGTAVSVVDSEGVTRSYDVWATDDFPLTAFTERVS